MPSRASVTLVGHLGSDPEERFTQNGLSIASFSIGVNDGRKDNSGEWEDHTSWYRVSAFGKTAEQVGERARKGTLVMVQGRLSASVWNPGDGKEPRVNLDVAADNVLVLERAGDAQEQPGPAVRQPRARQTQRPATVVADGSEDLPF